MKSALLFWRKLQISIFGGMVHKYMMRGKTDRLMKRMVIIIGVLAAFLYDGVAAERVPVFVTIVPQKYFAQQIGQGDEK